MNEAELLREFTERAKALQLEIDCLGAGNVNSEICIISEAPGENETDMKMPLIGPSGRLLWDVLRKLNITRKDCYVTNVIKRSLVINTKKDAKIKIKPTELEHWERLLDWELDNLPNVKYILALGNSALHALVGEVGITKWRGSVFDCKIGLDRRTVKVIVTNNPAHILRNLQMEPMYGFDIKKLRRVIDGDFTEHRVTGLINPSVDDALGYMEQLERDRRPIAFDIETIANETACIGFANNAYEGICINFRDSTTNRYSLIEERILRTRIQQFLNNTTNRFIAQNGSFDCGWLGFKDRIHVPKLWFDTLLAHHTLYPRMPHNLGYLTAQYTDHPFYKDEGKTWREGGNIDQFWHYNIKDCCITWACHVKLLAELDSQGLKDFYFNHVQRLQPHLIQMQVGGILADLSMKNDLAATLKAELADSREAFAQEVKVLTGGTFVCNEKILNSSKQLKSLFFEYLGLVGRGTSSDKANRQKMKEHRDTTPECIALIEHIDKHKEEHKFYSTYATMRVDDDNRIRCEYKQFGVKEAPGRLSSSGTLWGSGTNLQNQPHRAYPMFICDPGYELSYFDLRQAEAKIVSEIWQVKALIENFKRAEEEDGFDVHRGNASRIFKLPYDEIPEGDWDEDLKPTKRYLGKRCVHGLNYRMSADRLAEVCSIPVQQAYEAYASYHRAFPEIKKGWDATIETVRETRKLFSPLGRRLIWLERLTEESYDSVIAFVPQSTIGDKVSSVIYLCHEDPEWPEDARMLLNIHDALIAIHRPEDGVLVRKIMNRHAQAPIMINDKPVVIFTDLKKSMPGEDGIHRWSTLEDVTA
jgi:uracil-DNA glycosylase family 4